MIKTLIDQSFPLVMLDQEQIQNRVYLGDVEKNIEIFNALLKGKKAINELIPNHFENLNKCCRAISSIIQRDDFQILSFENEVRSGFPFLMLYNYPSEDCVISNRMNYATEKLTHIEASMAINAMSYCYLCESTENEIEAEFSAFMLDFIKILASHNYETECFNSSGFYNIID